MESAAIRAFVCSPRSEGNTDAMAHHFVQGVRAGGGKAEVIRLRDYTVLPCAACGSCGDAADAGCLLGRSDDAETLFRQIETAALVCMLSPIFFYHLPAQFKCLIDRAQRHWVRRQRRSESPPSPRRPGLVGLVAARARGERLFTGSMLTLKLFLGLFDIRVMDDCRLGGYDRPGELARDAAACLRLHAMGVKAAALAAQRAGRR